MQAMSLSAAIFLGSKLRPQGVGGLTTCSDSPFSCAIGAALQAATDKRIVDECEAYQILRELWPFVDDDCACPECPDQSTLTSIIFHLNDNHSWTREQIASWVAQFEPRASRPEPQPEPQPEAEAVFV